MYRFILLSNPSAYIYISKAENTPKGVSYQSNKINKEACSTREK